MEASLPDELYADLVLVNGHVLTVDSRDSVADAVAVKGNLIQAVGANEDIYELVGAKTEVMDLREGTLLPGLIDSHMHPGSYGVFKTRGVQCGPDIESIEELLSRLKKKAGATPEGRWILGYRLDDVKLEMDEPPSWPSLARKGRRHGG